jgi:hypothetical protein
VTPGAAERRIEAAATQAVFREVNERVHMLQQEWGTPEVDFICECADAMCSGALHVPTADYERVRSNPLHFVVIPEHLVGGAELLVERGAGYWIVEVAETESAYVSSR